MVEENAGMSTCPICKREWLVTPIDDCLMPFCGCYGQDVGPTNPARPCERCGLDHLNKCNPAIELHKEVLAKWREKEVKTDG